MLNCVEWNCLGNLFTFYRKNILSNKELFETQEVYNSYESFRKFLQNFSDLQGERNKDKLFNSQQKRKRNFYFFYSAKVASQNPHLFEYIHQYESEAEHQEAENSFYHIIEFIDENEEFIKRIISHRKNIDSSLIVILEKEQEEDSTELMRDSISHIIEQNPNCFEAINRVYLKVKMEVSKFLQQLNFSCENRATLKAREINNRIKIENIFTARNYMELFRVFEKNFVLNENSFKIKQKILKIGNSEIEKLANEYY